MDLGCGSYSYIPSVGLDISEKMLKLNDNLTERVVSDLESELPFNSSSFDSVTLVFVLNYVENYNSLLSEIFRVLRDNGQLVVIQPKNPVNSWQQQKAVNSFSLEDWKLILEKYFKVTFYEKEELGFFICSQNKQKTI